MLAINLSRDSEKFLRRLLPKHRRQVTIKIFKLAENPDSQDSSKLRGYENFYRVDAGEYRIIYYFTSTIIFITLVGKRNDSDVYRKLSRSNN